MKQVSVSYTLKNGNTRAGAPLYHEDEEKLQRVLQIMEGHEHIGSRMRYGQCDISFRVGDDCVDEVTDKLTDEEFSVKIFHG